MSRHAAILRQSDSYKGSLSSCAYYVFLLAGVLGLLYAGYVFAAKEVYQVSAARQLERAAPNQVWRNVSEGSVLGQIEVPRLGITGIVAEGVSSDVLQHAVGHIPQTALPGELGNVGLAGHRDTFFRSLRKVQAGDAIALKTPAGRFEYRVAATLIVTPEDTQVLEPSGERTLTLVTCFPFSYIGAAPDRFIVRARFVAYYPLQSGH
jgi:sortase A